MLLHGHTRLTGPEPLRAQQCFDYPTALPLFYPTRVASGRQEGTKNINAHLMCPWPWTENSLKERWPYFVTRTFLFMCVWDSHRACLSPISD